MEKNEHVPQAVFHAAVVQLVTAKNKKLAIEAAAFQLNPANFQLDNLVLVNEQGLRKEFKVLGPDFIEWYDAESAEFSGRFQVTGHIRLLVSPREDNVKQLRQSTYFFPQSHVQEKPAWVVMTEPKPVFVTVQYHQFVWKTVPKESNDLSRVG